MSHLTTEASTEVRCRYPGAAWGCTRPCAKPCAVRAEAEALDRQASATLQSGDTVLDGGEVERVLPGDLWSLAGILLFVGSQQQFDDPAFASVAKLGDRAALMFCQRAELVQRIIAGWKVRMPTAAVLLERRAQVPVAAEDPDPSGV